MFQLGEELPWKGGSSFDGEYTSRFQESMDLPQNAFKIADRMSEPEEENKIKALIW